MAAAPNPYDAADPVLPLLGGGTGTDGNRDWIIMRSDAGLLERARGAGRLLHVTGRFLLLLANVRGAIVLQRQFHNRTETFAPDEKG